MDKSDDEFVDIFGGDYMIDVLSTTALVTEPLIEEGTTYGFRYRARNLYGWGDWSPVTYILASSVPDVPPSPAYVSSTDNSITLTLYPSLASNGSPLTTYELWMAEGDSDIEDSFAKVDSYDGWSMQHEVTYAIDGIVSGQLYSFMYRSQNSKGYSDFSTVLTVAAISAPAKPNAPQVDYDLSSSDSLFIKWDQVSDTHPPSVTGNE